jgi:hypothetical protein
LTIWRQLGISWHALVINIINALMKQSQTSPQPPGNIVQKLEQYSQEDLKLPFEAMKPNLLKRWMTFFIREEKYEVCQIIRDVMDAPARVEGPPGNFEPGETPDTTYNGLQ